MRTKLLLFLQLFIVVIAASNQSFHSLSNNSTVFSVLINEQQVTVETYGDKCFRILKYPENKEVEKISYVVSRNQDDAKIRIKETKKEFILSISKHKLLIDKLTGIIRFADARDNILLSEKATSKPFIPTTDINGDGYKVKQVFGLAENEAIYGFGQDQRGIMNYRGQSVWLKHRNMYVAVPFFVSTKGYGVLWDNTSITNFEDNASGASFESEIGDCIDYYFVAGDSMDGTIAAFRELTGKAPMFPKWAFGFMQCRERYTNEYEIVDVVKKYRDLKLPLDGIIQDWRYWGHEEGQWNSTEFENVNFSNPKKMIEDIHVLNAHAMISVWPSFGNTSKIYQELDSKNMLFDFGTFPNTGKEKVYDAFNKEARDIYWKHLNKNIFSIGMDSWWLDATEPEQSSALSFIDSTQTALGSYKRVANAYPLFTNKGVYENQRATTSDKRVFILTRSAFAGQQRYATAVWSGDVNAGWDVFRNQIASGVNFSMSGIPYWTTDIGAFTVDPNKFPGGCKNPFYQELYVRWFQFGAFSPLFRSHGSSTPREVYNFGEKGFWAYDVQEKYLNLRYRLLPYIYSLAWKVTSDNASIMRAMAMDFPDDSIAQHINNQYLFGPSMLVAPVTEAQYIIEKGGKVKTGMTNAKQSLVYLPNDDWYDFWTGEKVRGGRYINRETPIDIIPLYVRAGSIIPVGETMQYATQIPADNLELRIYTGKDAGFLLYEDENDNYNYEKGQYSTIPIHWSDTKNTLIIGKRTGSFPGMITERSFNIVLVSEKAGYGDQLTEHVYKTIKYCGEELVVKI